jgi:cytochrome P450
MINIYALHHNQDEWQRHDEYLPERFDPESPLFFTPAGKKRHPMSFGPFFGGKRICLGKTFSEYIAKVFATVITMNYDLKFVDQEHYNRKPLITVASAKPVIKLTATKRA